MGWLDMSGGVALARVAIVEPRSSGWQLIDCAVALGHEVVVLTADAGGRRIPGQHLRQARHVEILDTNDDRAVLDAIERLHRKERLDAVLPGFEYYVPLAAQAAAGLGLPGIPPATARSLVSKPLMRQVVDDAGLDQPRYALAGDEAGLDRAVAAVGLPCVIKPADQCGSLHVRKAGSLAAARAAFAAACHLGDPELGRPGSGQVLVEEYVAGPEVSVDGFVQDGTAHVLSVTSKLLGPEPAFVEVGHLVPSGLDPADQARLARYVTQVVAAFGLPMGPFHAEARLSDRGPLLIEVAGRLPGDQIPRLLVLARGVDLWELMVRGYLGQRSATAFPPFRRVAGIRYFLRPGLRQYREVTDASVRADPRLAEVAMLHPPGVPVPPADSSRGRLGYAIAAGDSHRAVTAVLEAADRECVFS
jgi:biotin carboxylase